VILEFTRKADDDLDYFKLTGNKQVIKKVKELLESVIKDPFKGIGQPEPLKHNLSGVWSRRINREHRLIYEVKNERIYVLSLKGHY
jgi:toxin YoeB